MLSISESIIEAQLVLIPLNRVICIESNKVDYHKLLLNVLIPLNRVICIEFN